MRSESLPQACGTEGHPGCGNVGVDVYVVGWEPLFKPTGLLTLSCGSDRLFTSPLIKINGPSLLLGSSFPIHLSDGVGLPEWPLCRPNSDSFRTVLCTALEKGQHSRFK